MPAGAWASGVLELRDASLLDAPARLVASVVLKRQRLAPGAQLSFSLQAPALPAGSAGVLRAELRVGGAGGAVFLSTQACSVPAAGDADGLQVPLTRVA